jgi:hypothetical protein
MRFVLALLAAAPFALAQSNVLEVYPDGTNAGTNVYWRGNVVQFAPGELLQMYPERYFRGIGDAGTFWLGPPACSVRGVGFVTWNITTTFLPVTVPCAQDWYAGLRVPQGSAADALLVAASRWTVGPGDNPWPAAPTFAWEIPTPCSPTQLLRHTWHYGLIVDCPTLAIGADHPGGLPPDPGFGMAGMFPIDARPDGLCWRVRDIANAGGTAQLWLSFPPVSGGFIPGLSLQPLLKGSLHLFNITTIATGVIPASGEVILCHPCFVPGGFCIAPGVPWEFQAVTFGSTPQPRLSNAQRTTPQ